MSFLLCFSWPKLKMFSPTRTNSNAEYALENNNNFSSDINISLLFFFSPTATQHIKKGNRRERRGIQSYQNEAQYRDGRVWLLTLASIIGGERSFDQRYKLVLQEVLNVFVAMYFYLYTNFTTIVLPPFRSIKYSPVPNLNILISFTHWTCML